MLGEHFDLVAGDFNATAWQCSNGNNISTIEEAFADCALPTPLGSPPLWRPGSIPRMLGRHVRVPGAAESDRYWNFRHHGAFSIPHEALGLLPTDQCCHNETWLHREIVDWRSAQSHHAEHDRRILLKELSTACPFGQQKRRISDVMSDQSLSS